MIQKLSFLCLFFLLLSKYGISFSRNTNEINDSLAASIINEKIHADLLINDLDSIIFLNDQLLNFASIKNNSYWKGIAYQNLGKLNELQGKNILALNFYQKSLKIGDEIKNDLISANSKMELGYIYSKQGNINLALDYLEESYNQFNKAGNLAGAMNTLLDMSIIYGENNNLPTARLYCEEIITKVRSSESDFNLGNTLLIFALHNIRSNADSSFLLLGQAHDLFQNAGDTLGLIDVKRAQAQIYRFRKEFNKALPLYLQVIEAKQRMGINDGLPDLFCKVAEIQWQNNDRERALKNAQLAEMQLPVADDIEEILSVYKLLSKFYKEMGESELAASNLKKYENIKQSFKSDFNNNLLQERKLNFQVEKEEIQNNESFKNQPESKNGKFQYKTISIVLIFGLVILAFFIVKRKKR